MNLTDFCLLKENDESYTIGHPEGNSISVPKKGLSVLAQKLISKLKRHESYAEGGEVDPNEPGGENDPFASPTPVAAAPPEPTPPPSAPQMTAQDEQAIAQQQQQQTPPQQQVSDIGKTFNNEPIQSAEAAIKKGAQAEAQQGKTEADVYQDAAQQAQQVQNDFNQRLQTYQAKDEQFLKQLQSNKIDPDRYWNNMGTGSRIASALAIAISGIGAGITGGPNQALSMINKSIDNDISAQMNEQNKSMNLWKMNRQALGDDRSATLATQSQLLNIAKVKAVQAQAMAQGDIAKARVAPTILGLEQQIQQNNRMRTMFDLANTPAGQGLNKIDPAQLVESLVPKEHQQKVYDEIQAAQDTKRMSGAIMKSFDEAARDNTVLKTGAGFARVPGSVYALHQAMQPTFKDLEGTVRQAAMENTFKNITPAPGDLESTVSTKRQALADYLRSKASAPVAKGNHIDLSRFDSTAPSQGGAYAPGSVIEVKGKGQFKIGPDGNSLVSLR